jgi:hypothetical protein
VVVHGDDRPQEDHTMNTTARLNLEYIEGDVSSLSLVFDAPSHADVKEIIGWLQSHGATIKAEHLFPNIRRANGHKNGASRNTPRPAPVTPPSS